MRGGLHRLQVCTVVAAEQQACPCRLQSTQPLHHSDTGGGGVRRHAAKGAACLRQSFLGGPLGQIQACMAWHVRLAGCSTPAKKLILQAAPYST